MTEKAIVGKMDFEGDRRETIYVFAVPGENDYKYHPNKMAIGKLIGLLYGDEYRDFVDFEHTEMIENDNMGNDLSGMVRRLSDRERAEMEVGIYNGIRDVKGEN